MLPSVVVVLVGLHDYISITLYLTITVRHYMLGTTLHCTIFPVEKGGCTDALTKVCALCFLCFLCSVDSSRWFTWVVRVGAPSKYGVPFVSKLKIMLVHVFTIHAGIYDSCWYLRSMLVFTVHAGIYNSCWYLRFMLVFTIHAGIVNTSMKCKYQHES